MTNNIQFLRSELAAIAAEINRLGNITARQQTTSEKLFASFRLMVNRTSRIQTLENAIKIGKNKIQQTMTTYEERIRFFERDFPDLKKKIYLQFVILFDKSLPIPSPLVVRKKN